MTRQEPKETLEFLEWQNKTLLEKIKSLENENSKLKNEVLKLEEENKELRAESSNWFNKYLEIEKQNLKSLKESLKINPRGAGRKQKLTDTDKETIRSYKAQGKTIREIADLYNCSVGLVHKIINEK